MDGWMDGWMEDRMEGRKEGRKDYRIVAWRGVAWIPDLSSKAEGTGGSPPNLVKMKGETCIEAEFRNPILVGTLLTRSIRPEHTSLHSFAPLRPDFFRAHAFKEKINPEDTAKCRKSEEIRKTIGQRKS